MDLYNLDKESKKFTPEVYTSVNGLKSNNNESTSVYGKVGDNSGNFNLRYKKKF